MAMEVGSGHENVPVFVFVATPAKGSTCHHVCSMKSRARWSVGVDLWSPSMAAP